MDHQFAFDYIINTIKKETGNNINNVSTFYLRKMFKEINDYFNLDLIVPQKIEWSNHQKVIAGNIRYSKKTKRIKRIAFSNKIIKEDAFSRNTVERVNGMQCKDKYQILYSVMCHEIAHYIELKEFGKTGHGTCFKNIVRKYFGHTETYHMINVVNDRVPTKKMGNDQFKAAMKKISQDKRSKNKHLFHVGQEIQFTHNNVLYVGIIKKKNKVTATVKVEFYFKNGCRIADNTEWRCYWDGMHPSLWSRK